MISFSEACDIINNSVQPLQSKKVEFNSTLDRVLDEDTYSTSDFPFFDNSAMDGYAIVAEDTKGATEDNPSCLKVVDSIFAGYEPKYAVKRGDAAKIMTGGIVPEGADSVIPVENTKSQNDRVFILKPVRVGENIRYKGEEIKAGELILKRGTLVGPAEVGMFATLGLTEVKVFPSPRVSVIATGDELVEPGEPLGPGKLRNSNSHSLSALISQHGGVPLNLGIARDNETALEEKIRVGLENSDMIITAAGISVGEGDIVRPVFQKLGAKVLFWQVAIRPGKPTAFGTIEGVPFFSLPGNPVSCAITFRQFVIPALLIMRGIFVPRKNEIRARLEHNIEKKKGLRYFFRVKVRKAGEEYFASLTGPQGSGMLTSMIRSDGLLVVPEDRDKIPEGEVMTVELHRQISCSC